MPPEPGFARREAHRARNWWIIDYGRRLLKRWCRAAARKEGAHEGNQGFLREVGELH